VASFGNSRAEVPDFSLQFFAPLSKQTHVIFRRADLRAQPPFKLLERVRHNFLAEHFAIQSHQNLTLKGGRTPRFSGNTPALAYEPNGWQDHKSPLAENLGFRNRIARERPTRNRRQPRNLPSHRIRKSPPQTVAMADGGVFAEVSDVAASEPSLADLGFSSCIARGDLQSTEPKHSIQG
jgi:hypothetical protein